MFSNEMQNKNPTKKAKEIGREVSRETTDCVVMTIKEVDVLKSQKRSTVANEIARRQLLKNVQ